MCLHVHPFSVIISVDFRLTDQSAAARTIVVFNVSQKASEDNLGAFFGYCGKVRELRQQYDRAKDEFCWSVEFDRAEAARTACMLHGTQLLGTEITITSKGTPPTALARLLSAARPGCLPLAPFFKTKQDLDNFSFWCFAPILGFGRERQPLTSSPVDKFSVLLKPANSCCPCAAPGAFSGLAPTHSFTKKTGRRPELKHHLFLPGLYLPSLWTSWRHRSLSVHLISPGPQTDVLALLGAGGAT